MAADTAIGPPSRWDLRRTLQQSKRFWVPGFQHPYYAHCQPACHVPPVLGCRWRWYPGPGPPGTPEPYTNAIRDLYQVLRRAGEDVPLPMPTGGENTDPPPASPDHSHPVAVARTQRRRTVHGAVARSVVDPPPNDEDPHLRVRGGCIS